MFIKKTFNIYRSHIILGAFEFGGFQKNKAMAPQQP
jgi:hypothetical protein